MIMTKYANIKTKKFKKSILKWLQSSGATIIQGGKHTKIKCNHNGKGFTVPDSHGCIDKHILRNLVKFLAENEICAQEEFDKRLK